LVFDRDRLFNPVDLVRTRSGRIFSDSAERATEINKEDVMAIQWKDNPRPGVLAETSIGYYNPKILKFLGHDDKLMLTCAPLSDIWELKNEDLETAKELAIRKIWARLEGLKNLVEEAIALIEEPDPDIDEVLYDRLVDKYGVHTASQIWHEENVGRD